jgi:hypothetical protein
MTSTQLLFIVPDDPHPLARLTARLATDGEPRVGLRRTPFAVLAFEAQTGEMMLRSRAIQALLDVLGPDWQQAVRPVALSAEPPLKWCRGGYVV